jgi:hypothetical protein
VRISAKSAFDRREDDGYHTAFYWAALSGHRFVMFPPYVSRTAHGAS